MNGYVNKQYEFLKLNKKKYYNTGDLVKIEKGEIYWLSRNDGMIKKKGLRIYTTEIDEIVEKYNKDTISKTIFINDELILFFKGNTNQNKILKNIRNYLPSYMHPSNVFKIKDFPIGPTGKIDINRLKKIYAST